MKKKDFTTSISVDRTPSEVFAAINNVRGWWSENIKGDTDKLDGIFEYRYQDVHRCKIKVTGLIPEKRVEWLVLNNYFKFTEDKTEWLGTKIIFEIAVQDGKTDVQFTHLGLVPEYECFNICRDAWTGYIQKSLKNLIVTGKGSPNPKEESDFTTSFTVDKTPADVFAAINNVAAWWSGEVTGAADKAGAEFTYQVANVHRSVQQVTEFTPGLKIVWHVTDAELSFAENKKEWKGTDITFVIIPDGKKTEVRFTHAGLSPDFECYDQCSNAWGLLVNGNLRRLIETGKDQPSPW